MKEVKKYILWKKGCPIRNIFIYPGCLFIDQNTHVIGYLMEWYLKNKNFKVKQP
jgi:hypothetical protein